MKTREAKRRCSAFARTAAVRSLFRALQKLETILPACLWEKTIFLAKDNITTKYAGNVDNESKPCAVCLIFWSICLFVCFSFSGFLHQTTEYFEINLVYELVSVFLTVEDLGKSLEHRTSSRPSPWAQVERTASGFTAKKRAIFQNRLSAGSGWSYFFPPYLVLISVIIIPR